MKGEHLSAVRLHFRPLPVLSLFALAGFGALVALGVWQAQRAGWKAGLIAAAAERAVAAPERLTELTCLGAANGSGRVFQHEPSRVMGRPIRVYGFDAGGAPGWRSFGWLTAPDCEAGYERAVLAELSFQPIGPDAQDAGAPRTPRNWRIEAWPRPGMFSAANNPDRNEWHRFDAAAMAAALGVSDGMLVRDDMVLISDEGAPSALTRTPPVRHIAYSATWFGLAAALFVFYLALHVRGGRLKIGGAAPAP